MARSSVRQMWKDKLEGKLAPKSWPEAPTLARPPFAGRVLGVDPSLRGTGLALIEFAPGRTPVLLRCQTVKVAAHSPTKRCMRAALMTFSRRRSGPARFTRRWASG